MRGRRRKKSSNKLGIFGITLIVVLFCSVLLMKESELKAKNVDYVAKESQLVEKIEKESERSSELEEQAKYVQTKKYVEDIAKEKLGLVYKDEIIFKPTE